MKNLKSEIGERKSAEASMDFGAQRDVQAQIRTLKGALHWEGNLEEMRISKRGAGSGNRKSEIGNRETGIGQMKVEG